MDTLDTYVVNLDRSQDRMLAMKKQLERQGMAFTRVPAIEGSRLSASEVRENTTLMCGLTCTASMIGCGMSHRKVWRQVMRSNRAGLVFEDDAVLVDDFPLRVKEALAACPSDYDVLVLGCFFLCNANREYPLVETVVRPFFDTRDDTRTWTHGSTTVFVPERFAGTHAYIVSPKGARALLKAIPKIRWHVDMEMNHPSIRLYAASPDLAFQRDMASSTIASMSFPVVLAPMLNTKNHKGIPVAYYLSVPWGQVGPGDAHVDINVWFVAFLVAGLASPVRWWPYFAGFFLAEIMVSDRRGPAGPAAAYIIGNMIRRYFFCHTRN
jgi:GR25 family glycosyltransferase involved in LPS biosynthesis